MTPEDQLDEWVKGNSIHNTEHGECCPDFSCCQSHYKAPESERQMFKDRPELRHSMLLGFLAGALADKNVHIAGSIGGEA